jgi:hypothetical protein
VRQFEETEQETVSTVLAQETSLVRLCNSFTLLGL